MTKSTISTLIALCLSTFLLSGCNIWFPGVYRINIPQGNLIDEKKVADLKVGMEPRQVRYLMGTPLINDTFNPDRWDYFYSVKKDNKITVDHHMVITFSDGRVSSIENREHNN